MLADPEHAADCVGAALRGEPSAYAERGCLLIGTALGSLVAAHGRAFLEEPVAPPDDALIPGRGLPV